jgi:hypothetical protein
VSDLNTKIQDLENENEKMSLITVIKLLQEDNNPASTNVKNKTSGTQQISKPKATSKAQGMSVNEEPIKSARSTNVGNQ